MNDKAQTLSLDLMIGIMIFVAVLMLFFGVMMFRPGQADVSALDDEGEFVIEKLESQDSEVGIIEQNRINDKELEEMFNSDYKTLKKEFGIQNDFCIFLEDENGKVIKIETSEGEYVAGIGSGDAKIAGSNCETNPPVLGS